MIKKHNKSLKALVNVFHKYREIDAVYLFGSCATGKTHRESDLDLAVYSKSAKILDKKLDILADLVRAGYNDVDLVFLNRASIVLQFQVVRLNKLIYSTPGFSKADFFSKTVRQYFDFYPYLTVQRKAYKKRILNG